MNINNYLSPYQSINITASAGTGKTWVIISKILRLLLEGEDPNKITAITFTKKASTEMKDRLNDKIEGWANLSKPEIRKELEEIGISKNFEMYEKKAKGLFYDINLKNKDIRISTFDSFFIELLSLFHLDKDIEKKFEMITELETQKIIENVEKKIFSKRFLKKNKNLEQDISFLIKHIKSYFSLKESLREVIYKKSYYLEISHRLNVENCKFNDKRIKVDEIKKEFLRNISIILGKTNLHNHFQDIETLINSDHSNYDDKIMYVEKYFFTKEKKIRKNVIKKFEKINLDCDKFLKIFLTYELKLFEELQLSWKNILVYFITEYQDHLSELNFYDFSDKTWLCYKKLSLLDDDDWIFYKISNSINHMLIDEFQDTNFIQWKIIEMILRSIKNSGYKSSITVVGDKKQSIYGFRGSESKLFDICKNYTSTNFHAKNINLNKSYRSSKSVIKFLNEKFSEDNRFTTVIKKNGSIIIEDLSEKIKDNIEEKLLTNDMLLLESENISEQIHILNKEKNINFNDILVLVRNRTHINHIKDSLTRNNIPVVLDNRICLMQTSEIKDICNLLKLIILDEEDFNLLYSVLISPIFEIKMNDLTNIKSNDFDALKKFIYKSKIGKKYDEWQKLIGKIPIHDLLDKIYSDINIFEKYNTENELRIIEIKNNLLNFLNLSLKINNGRFISPFFFLNQIEAMENHEESYEFDSLDSVKVLTIHAAKGLESKIVIFAQSYLKNNLMKDKVYPIFNTDFSCKDLIYKPEVFKNNCLIDRLFKDSKNKQLNEEENLAYVACTRAKDILIINGFASKKATWFSNFSSSQ